jgi:hypothetical protein
MPNNHKASAVQSLDRRVISKLGRYWCLPSAEIQRLNGALAVFLGIG